VKVLSRLGGAQGVWEGRGKGGTGVPNV
jgi:hypothetical protein